MTSRQFVFIVYPVWGPTPSSGPKREVCGECLTKLAAGPDGETR